ncbi:MAG: hypothetical protein DRJ08_05115 [Acidobacteria bacterium]|nr:MAG: hypothetical protein DRJ14_01255 [Acidobacteriota bacterium]RLE21746.1 MAG: hypothetical protein DRJ08_05115 [Acidobacteriota bacterium]
MVLNLRDIGIKFFRIGLIICAMTGLLWVGSHFSLLEQKGEADVYELFQGPQRGMPDFQEGGQNGDIGHTLVNGQRFAYSIEVVPASVHEVISFYKKLYTPRRIRMIPDADMKRMGFVPGSKASRILEGFERVIGLSGAPVFTKEGPSYGFLGVLDKGDNEKWFIKKGSMKDSVVGKVVVAMKEEPDSDKTTVIRYWTEGPFQLEKIFPQNGEDVPGEDLEDVDRHPYSQRLLSMEQADKWGVASTLIYAVDDTPANTSAYYLADLRGNGWSVPDAAIKGARRAGYKLTLFARKGGRQLTILFGRTEGDSTLVTMIEQMQK